MDKHTTSSIKLLSFDKIYTETLRPKLGAIDLFLKENTSPFQVYDVADILEIEPAELKDLMETHQITEINSIHFFTLVLNASSEICGLIRRQFKYGQTSTYTPEMIADIYKLNIHKVKSAFTDLSTELVTDVELVDIFKRIHLISYSNKPALT